MHERGGRFPQYRMILECKKGHPFIYNTDVKDIDTLNLIFPFPVTIISISYNN